MTMKYKVTKVFATDTKKDGTKMINKWGKPQWRVGLQLEGMGDEWINGFLPFNPDRWEGSEQELILEEEEYNGEKRKKFSTPKTGGIPNEAVMRIEKYVAHTNDMVNRIYKHLGIEDVPKTGNTDLPYPEYTGAPSFGATPSEPPF